MYTHIVYIKKYATRPRALSRCPPTRQGHPFTFFAARLPAAVAAPPVVSGDTGGYPPAMSDRPDHTKRKRLFSPRTLAADGTPTLTPGFAWSPCDHLVHYCLFMDPTAPPRDWYSSLVTDALKGFPIVIQQRSAVTDQVWAAIHARHPVLAKWQRSDDYLRVPTSWPAPIATWFKDHHLGHLTPLHWALSCFPHNKRDRASLVYSPPYLDGLAYLTAYCHGYPVTYAHHTAALRVLELLLEHPPFLLWALNADLSAIPPSSENATLNRNRSSSQLSWVTAFIGRQDIADDPLCVSRIVWLRSLPDWSWDTDLMWRLPRHPDWTRRSSRKLPALVTP